jgi:glycosyltransferase 2 family protein
MKKNFLLALKLIISFVLIFLVFKLCDIDIVRTWTKLRNTDIKWFIIGCILFIGTTFTNTYRWLKLASVLGYKTNYFHGLKTYFESTFANNFLPTGFGGDALKAYDLGKSDKSWLRSASTVIMERLFGFVFLFAQVPIGLVISKYTPLRDALPLKLELALWLSFLAVILSIISYPLWSKIPLGIVQKIRFSVQEYTSCYKSLIDVAVWTFGTHVLFVGGNIAMGLAMGAGIDRIPIWFWLILVPASSLAGFVIPSVKGVGAKEASYIYMLGLIGINHDLGLAIAFQTFVATVIASLPGASIAFRRMKFPKSNKELSEEAY